jgi:hypothetical protein
MPRWHPRTRSTNGPIPFPTRPAKIFPAPASRAYARSPLAPSLGSNYARSPLAPSLGSNYARSPLAVSLDSMVKMAS